MPYTPQTWTNDVSKLNATRMNFIETGIDNAHITADGAVQKPGGLVDNEVLVYDSASGLWVSEFINEEHFITGKIFDPTKIKQSGASTEMPLVWDGTNWAPALLKSSGMATGLNGPPGTQLAHNEFTSNVDCTATTEATATQIVAASAVSFDGATAVLIEFYAPGFFAGDAPVFSVYLYDGTSIGRIVVRAVTTNAEMGMLYGARKLTPSNASHTYSIRGAVSSGAGVTVRGGAGGVGAEVPGFIRITKV